MLEVYGDFSTAEMKAKLEQLFGAWKYTQPAVPAFPKVDAKPAPGVFLATKDDVTQTFFHVGHLGGELRDKDYPALEVAARDSGRRIFQPAVPQRSHRSTAGPTTSARTGPPITIIPGTFDISGSTQSAHTVDTLKAIGEEMEKIRTSEVTDEELQTAKDTVLNGFVFHLRPAQQDAEPAAAYTNTSAIRRISSSSIRRPSRL